MDTWTDAHPHAGTELHQRRKNLRRGHKEHTEFRILAHLVHSNLRNIDFEREYHTLSSNQRAQKLHCLSYKSAEASDSGTSDLPR